MPLFFFIAFFGSMRPNATAIALTNQGAIAGTASAWVGALPFLLGAFLSPLAGLGGEGAATVAGIMLAALCVAGLPCVLLIARVARNRYRGAAGPHSSGGPLTLRFRWRRSRIAAQRLTRIRPPRTIKMIAQSGIPGLDGATKTFGAICLVAAGTVLGTTTFPVQMTVCPPLSLMRTVHRQVPDRMPNPLTGEPGALPRQHSVHGEPE